jgi:hypothetical protein
MAHPIPRLDSRLDGLPLLTLFRNNWENRGASVMKYTVEVIGWVAAAMMLSAYVLLTMGRLTARSNVYHWLNVLSGAGFIINLSPFKVLARWDF